MADAVTWAVAYVGSSIGGTAGATMVMYSSQIAAGLMFATTVAVSADQQRRQRAKARSAANAALKDREVMLRSAVAPRRVIYGRDMVSGPIVYAQSTGDKGQYLHLVVALAAHECDAIEEVWFNDVRLPEPDAAGWIQSGEFSKAATREARWQTFGAGSFTLAAPPVSIVALTRRRMVTSGAGDGLQQNLVEQLLEEPADYVRTGASIVTSGHLAGDEYFVHYEVDASAPKVRVRRYLGSPDQQADPDLVAESGGKWTAAHRGRGICYLYVRLEYDQDLFGAIGLPNIRAVVRGKKVRDPRDGVVRWTDLAAPCIADYLLSPAGLQAASGELPDAEAIEATNICAEPVTLYVAGTVAVTAGSVTVVGTGTEWLQRRVSPGTSFVGPGGQALPVRRVISDTQLELAATWPGGTASGQAYALQQPRYTLNTSFTTDQSPRDVLADLLTSMAGRAVWTQGRWLLRAGAWRLPTATAITPDSLAGPIAVIPRLSRSELFNAVRVSHRDPSQEYAEVQAPLVANAGYQAADGGVRIVRALELPTLADTYRAQRLAKIQLERSRQALTVRLRANLTAYDIAPSDTVSVTLPQYGWAGKEFECLERSLSPDGHLEYTLRETAAGIWSWNLGEATIGDLAPDTSLPSPSGRPAELQGVTIAETIATASDGTSILQFRLTWSSTADVFVAQGGQIEVEYAPASSGAWIRAALLPGTATTVDAGDLTAGLVYVARVRQVNAVGRASEWVERVIRPTGSAAVPQPVSGLTWAIKPGQVQVRWAAYVATDYAQTELRVGGADWATAAFLWAGAGTEYQHPRPPNGQYLVRARHQNRLGNYSGSDATVLVTVDNSIDGTPGPPGPPGDPGQAGARGTVMRYLAGFNAWDSVAASASVPGGVPIVGDTVVQYNNVNFAQERTWNGSGWALPGTIVDGNVLVNGSVTAQKLNVINLAAVSGVMGNLTSGTITGAVIRTAASGARIEINHSSNMLTAGDGLNSMLQLNGNNGTLYLQGSDGVSRMLVNNIGTGMAIAAGSSDVFATVYGENLAGGPGLYGYSQSGPGVRASSLQIDQPLIAGSAVASFSGTNKPGGPTSALWLPVIINGEQCDIPVWRRS